MDEYCDFFAGMYCHGVEREHACTEFYVVPEAYVGVPSAGASYECGACAPSQCCHGAVEQRVPLAAGGGEFISGAVAFEIVPHDVPSDYVGSGIVVDHKQCAADVERCHGVVGVKEHDPFGGDGFKPAVARGCCSGLFFG